MKKVGLFFWIFPLVFFVLHSCSTTKKGIINQEYHTLTTKYNVLFNGKEAFAVGKQILEQAYEDNFYELIPVEPINLRGENIDESSIVPGFDRAEEKAVKSIQKHSMNINGNQYNRQIDAAYLLLGKARYFDRRFFPALEAFNFLLKSGANQSIFVQGKIWREKTNIRLQNHELAIQNLKPIAKSLNPRNKFYPLANATVAEAFINLKEIDSAAYYMKRAALAAPKRRSKARYLFISGQLFESLEKTDSAQWAYEAITDLKRKAPRKFYINAKIKQTLLNRSSVFEDRIERIERLLKNYENKPFEHVLNRSLGSLYLEERRDSLALIHFNRSLESPSIDSYTQIENYQDLSDYYFGKGNYLKTGDYLDKLLPLFDESTVAHKKLKRKRENLTEVIVYEKTIQKTDSILSLLSMNQEEQLQFFQNYIDEQQSLAEKILESQSKKSQFLTQKSTQNAFYFYNPKVVLKGRQTYKANWGNRPNVDNWRQTTSIQTVLSKTTLDSELSSKKAIFIQQTPESYVTALPKKENAKDSIIRLNQKAYLQLGMIYKEKFGDFPLARMRLDTLLISNPPEAIAVQALYHLYRMNEKEFPQVAAENKARLVTDYPDTSFARLLSDPDNYDDSGIITPETLYAKALDLFEKQDFKNVLREIESLEVVTSGSQMEPKIALLKAHTKGRLHGVTTWKEALQEVATNFSAVGEGINAKALIEQIEANNNLEEKGVIYKNYKWIFPFLNSNQRQSLAFYDQVKSILSTTKRNWMVSQDVYDETYSFVVIHGIRDTQEIEILKANKGMKSALALETLDNFVALTSQYRAYMKNKTWKNESK
jgi:hypothetical protein